MSDQSCFSLALYPCCCTRCCSVIQSHYLCSILCCLSTTTGASLWVTVDLETLFWWCLRGFGIRHSLPFPSDYSPDKHAGFGWPRASDALRVPPPGPACIAAVCLSLSTVCWESCLKLMAAARLTRLKQLYYRPTTTTTTQYTKHIHITAFGV